MIMPDIETERLLVRKFKETDIDDMYEYASDDIVTRYITWDTYKSKEEAVKYVNSIIKRYDNFELAPWAIEYKENGKMIGSIDIRYDSENYAAEIGYVLNKNYWNKGIMTEVLKEVIDFGFKNLNVNRLEMKHDVRNEPSGKVMLKNGFKYEGTLRNQKFQKGEFVDLKYYSMLREEYNI